MMCSADHPVKVVVLLGVVVAAKAALEVAPSGRGALAVVDRHVVNSEFAICYINYILEFVISV